MKVLARILFLLLVIASALWFLGSIPRLLGAMNRPGELAAAIGAATVPLIAFFFFVAVYVKLGPKQESSDSPVSAQSESKKGRIGPIFILLGLFGLIILFVFANVKRPPQQGAPANVSKSAWAVRKIKDISLEGPSELKFAADIRSKMPAENQATIDYAESYDSTGASKDFHVGVSRLGFKPSAKPDFEAGVESVVDAIKRKAKAAGDPDPKVETEPTVVSDFQARRLRYVGTGTPSRLRVDGLCVQDRTRVWQVLVFYGSDFQASDAARVLKSVRITSR